ncbi:MAG: hypothetical protein ABIO70_36760 [Pseudomonadota bacterium]
MRWFLEGGPLMWAVLVFFLCGGFMALIRAALAKKAEFPGAGLNLAALLLGCGMIGTLHGWQQAFAAVAYASAEMKAELLQAGMDAAWHPTTLAMICVALLAPLALIAMARARGRATTLVKVIGLGSGLLSFASVALALVICVILSSQLMGMFDATDPVSAAQFITYGIWAGMAAAALGALIALFGGLLLLPVGAVSAWKRRKEDEF